MNRKEAEIIIHSPDIFSPVGYLRCKEVEVVDK